MPVGAAASRIVVIGSSGALGQDLMGALGARAIGLTHADLDVTDVDAVTRVLQPIQPDWIINTAAMLRVDDCEREMGLAFAVNTAGAANVARAAASLGAGVAFISTDYVFSGRERSAGHAYTETDHPEPLNVYGASKRAGEHLVVQSGARHLILRTSALYGWTTSRKGWTFPDAMIRAARAGTPLRVVADQITSPTFTRDLARTTVELIDAGATGLFHAANSGECSWHEFAMRTLELGGVAANVEPIATSTAPTAARRPPYSALASEHLADAGVSVMRPWHDALAEYVAGRPAA